MGRATGWILTCVLMGIMALGAGCPRKPDAPQDGVPSEQDEETPGGEDSPGIGTISLSYSPPIAGHARDYDGVHSNASFEVVTQTPEEDFEPMPIDTCRVSVGEPEDWETPSFTWTPKDPGNPGTITVGSSQGRLVLMESDGYYYQQDPLYMPANGGDRVRASFPGGRDIPPFSVEGTLPHAIELFYPVLTLDQWGGWTTSFPFNQDLQLRWEASVPAQSVTLILLVTNGPENTETCVCEMIDDGVFNVPADLLQQLDMDNKTVGFTMYRANESETLVTLSDGTRGYMGLWMQTGVDAEWSE